MRKLFNKESLKNMCILSEQEERKMFKNQTRIPFTEWSPEPRQTW